MAAGRTCPIHWPGSLNQGLQPVHQRLRAREDGLENSGHDHEEDQRAGDGCKKTASRRRVQMGGAGAR